MQKNAKVMQSTASTANSAEDCLLLQNDLIGKNYRQSHKMDFMLFACVLKVFFLAIDR